MGFSPEGTSSVVFERILGTSKVGQCIKFFLQLLIICSNLLGNRNASVRWVDDLGASTSARLRLPCLSQGRICPDGSGSRRKIRKAAQACESLLLTFEVMQNSLNENQEQS